MYYMRRGKGLIKISYKSLGSQKMAQSPFSLLHLILCSEYKMEIITAFFTALKSTTPSLMFGVSIATSILLFLPDKFLKSIGLLDFSTQNRAYIGGLFLLSISINVVYVTTKSWKYFFYKWQARKYRHASEKALCNLTPDEKTYLIPYIHAQVTTQYFLLADGVASELVNKHILYRASTMGDMVRGFAFNIQPWAKEYLEKNPKLLEGANPNTKRLNIW